MKIDFTTRFASVVLACLFLSNDLMATTRVLFNGYQFQEKESYEPTLMAPLVDLNSALDLEAIPSESAVLEGELLEPVEIQPTNNNEEVIDRSAVLDFEILASSAEGADLKGVSVYAVSVAESYPIPGQYSNVTRGSYAWRLSREVGKDNTEELVKSYSIAIGVDAAKIHSQSQMNQVQVFFWDKEQARWKVSKVTKVDMARLRVEAMVPSETDYFAGLIKTPDMPEAGAFVPTNISDVEPANPATGMRLIQPPSINRQGSANVSYPLWVPQGRQGMTPSLAVSYSSDGGYSWAGNGWNVSTSSISVDTKWGVPTYSSTIESEGYLVDGQPVFQEGGHRPNIAEFDAAGNAQAHARQPSPSSFYPRVQSSYQKIERMGNTPEEYFWKITDASKTVRYYGSSDGQTVDNNSVLRKGTNGPIANWYLTRVEDQWGNYMEYEYSHFSNNTPDNIKKGGKSVYLSKITYTGHETTPGRYEVLFHTVGNAIDGRVMMNYGFKVLDDRLLDSIQVKYASKLLVTYDLRYSNSKDSHFKTLLTSIAEVRNGADFYEHTFDYYGGEITYNPTGTELEINHGYDYLSNAPWYAGAVSNSLYTAKKPSPINTSLTEGSSGHGGSGFGFSTKVAGVTYDKSSSVNIGISGSENSTDLIRQMMDVNGDGIQDMILREGENIYYRPIYKLGDGNLEIGPNIKIHADAVNTSKSRSFGAKVEVVGPKFAGTPQVGLNFSRNKSETTRRMIDYNADGFPDLVYRENGVVVVAFGKLDARGELKFYGSSQDTYNPVVKGASVVPNTNVDESTKPMEVVRIWEAFETGQIRITGTASMQSGVSGEVDIAIQHNGNFLAGGFTTVNSSTNKSFNQYLNVTKGDVIMFRSRSGEEMAGDLLVWNPVVRYTSGNRIDGQGTDWGLSSSHAGYVLSSFNTVTLKNDQKFRVNMNFINGAVLSDDVNLLIDVFKNGEHHQTYQETLLKGTTGSPSNTFAPFIVGNPALSGYTNIPNTVDGDVISLGFRVESSSNVQWNSLKWMPIVELESTCDNPIENLYPVPDYQIYNHLDLFGDELSIGGFRPGMYHQLIPVINSSTSDINSVITESSAPKGVVYMTVKSQGNLLQKIAIEFERNAGQLNLWNVDMASGKSPLDVSYVGQVPVSANSYSGASTGAFLDEDAGEGVKVEFFAKGPYAEGMIALVKSNLQQFNLIPESGQPIAVAPSPVSYFFQKTNELQMHYKHWGVFGWAPKDSEENDAINPEDLHFPLQSTAEQDPDTYDYGDVESNYGNYNPDDFTFWSLQAIRGENDRDFWDFQNDVIVTIRERDRYSLPGHPIGAFRKQGGFSPMIIGEMDLSESNPVVDQTNYDPSYGANVVLSSGRSYSLSVNGGSHGASGSMNVNDQDVFFSWQKNNLQDLNGDGFPDILQDDSGIKGQFTNPTGGYSNQSSVSNITVLGKGTSLGGNLGYASGLYSNNDKRFNIGGGLGLSASFSKVRSSLIDINGDGIPDFYEEYNNGPIDEKKFSLGNGYGFEDSNNKFNAHGAIRNQSYGGNISASSSLSQFNASWTEDVNSWSGGLNVNVVGNYTEKFYFDFNGDGLQDFVDLNGKNDLWLNTGVGFVKYSADYEVPENINKTGSTGIAAQASMTLGPIVNFFKIPIHGGYSDNYAFNRLKTSFIDMNGDGAPDFIDADNGNLTVHYAEFGKINKLKTVHNPIGGSFTVNYKVEGNKRGYKEPQIKTHLSEAGNEKILWDMPNSKWVMSSVTVDDGLDVTDGTDDLDGSDQYETKFAYDGGIRLRREREFAGFTRIATIQPSFTDELDDYCAETEDYEVEKPRQTDESWYDGDLTTETTSGYPKTTIEKIGAYNLSLLDYAKPEGISPVELKKYQYQKDILKNTYTLHVHEWNEGVQVYFRGPTPEGNRPAFWDSWNHQHIELLSDKAVDYELRLVQTGVGTWGNGVDFGQVIADDIESDDWLTVEDQFPRAELVPENITVFPAITDKRDINYPVVEDRTGVNTQKYHIKYDEYFNVVQFEDFGEVIQPIVDLVPVETIIVGKYETVSQVNDCELHSYSPVDIGNNHYYVVVPHQDGTHGDDIIYGIYPYSSSCGNYPGFGPETDCDDGTGSYNSSHSRWVEEEVIIYELQDNSVYDRKIIATMEYFDPSGTNVGANPNGRTNALKVHKIYSQNTNSINNLRRFTEVTSLTDDGEAPKEIVNHLTWGSTAELAITNMVYDDYGNVTNITAPENHQAQRAITSYTYDTDVHQFVERVDNAYGEFVCNVYDYGYQQLLQNTGINGHVMRYSYDANRRPEHIWAPREVNNPSNGPTISFEYDLGESIPVAYTYHNTGNSSLTVSFGTASTTCGSLLSTATWNKEMTSKVGTATFVDGMDRVAQIQTQTDWDDPTTLTDHSMVTKTQVSGHTEYNKWGMTISQRNDYLVNAADFGTFQTNASDIISKTRYDYLGRAVKSENVYSTDDGTPGWSITTVNRQWAELDGISRYMEETNLDGKSISRTFVDPKGRQVGTEAEGHGWLATKETTRFTYDDIGQMISSTNPAGQTTSYTYDFFGRVVEEDHPDRGVTSNTYDLAGNVTAIQTPGTQQTITNGKITLSYYYSRLESKTMPTNATYPGPSLYDVEYAYGTKGDGVNGAGRIVSVVQGGTTNPVLEESFEYDELGQTIKQTRSIDIPQAGVNSFVTGFKYDSFGRMLSVDYPDNESLIYHYSTLGNLTRVSVTDGVCANIPDLIEELSYDGFGNRVYMKYGNGAETEFGYHPITRGLMTSNVFATPVGGYTDRNVMAREYTYNTLGMVSNAAITPHRSFMNTSSTLSTEFTYDGLLRLGGATTTISETPYANGDPVEGNVNFDTYGGTMYSVETSYASAGRLANKTSNPESSVTPLVNNELDYSLAYNYNPANPHQIQTVTESYQGSLVSNQFTYNSSGSITNIARTGTGIPNGNIEMLWNEEQWMVADENNNGVHHYVYDYAGERIMKSSYSQTVLWQNENEAGSTGTLDAYTVYVNPYLVLNSYQNNEILYFKKTLHYYVGAERVASGEFSKFLQESPGEGGEEGRGPAKTSPLASSGSDASLEEGIISDNEALNDQSPKASNQVLDQLEEILTHFGYEEGKDFTRETLEKPVPLSTIYPEFVSTSTSSAGKQSGSFEIEVEAQPFSTANGSTIVEICEGLASEVYWYHNNYLGNVDLVTNTSGEVHQFFLYNAWGENMHEYNPVTPGFDSPYRFNAKELDKETGLAYYGARYYQNKFSVWLSVDRLAEKYPKSSPFVFAGNNPVKFIDPNGDSLDVANAYSYERILTIVDEEHRDRVINENGQLSVNLEGLSEKQIRRDKGLDLLSKMVGAKEKYLFEVGNIAYLKRTDGSYLPYNILDDNNGVANASNNGKDSEGGYKLRPSEGYDGQVSMADLGYWVDKRGRNATTSVTFHELAENYFRTTMGLDYHKPGNAHGKASSWEMYKFGNLYPGDAKYVRPVISKPPLEILRALSIIYIQEGIQKQIQNQE